jgi:hypothetical protein
MNGLITTIVASTLIIAAPTAIFVYLYRKNTLSNTIETIINLHSRLEKLNNELEELRRNTTQSPIKNDIALLDEKKNYNPINWIVAIFGLAFLFFLFAVGLNKICNFGISDDSIVLIFVGIAATFVVVSNYAQVIEVKNEFKNKVYEFERRINDIEEKFDKQQKEILKKIELMDGFIDIKKWDSRFEHFKSLCNENNFNYAIRDILLILSNIDDKLVKDFYTNKALELLKEKPVKIDKTLKEIILNNPNVYQISNNFIKFIEDLQIEIIKTK